MHEGICWKGVLLPFLHLPLHSSDLLQSHLEEVTSWAMHLQLVDCDVSYVCEVGTYLVSTKGQKFLSPSKYWVISP